MEAARESAAALRTRRGDDGLWRQDDDYRGLGTLHGVAGNTLALLRFDRDEALARETAAVLARHASREDGLANWPGTSSRPLVRPRDGRICLQWCTGAPGVLTGAWDYLDEELVLAGAELIWQAGAHKDGKGHGLCHGTWATASRSSRRSHAPATNAGSIAPAASPSTRSPKRNGSRPQTASADIHSSPETSAPHSSRPPASTSTRATRSSTSCRAGDGGRQETATMCSRGDSAKGLCLRMGQQRAPARLKGRRCMIEARGSLGTVLVRFLDTGERVTTSSRALRVRL